MKKTTSVTILLSDKEILVKLLKRDSEKFLIDYFSYMVKYFLSTGINPKNVSNNPIIECINKFYDLVEKRNKQMSNWIGKLDSKYFPDIFQLLSNIDNKIILESKKNISESEEISISNSNNFEKEIEDLKELILKKDEELLLFKKRIKAKIESIDNMISEDRKGIFLKEKLYISEYNIVNFKKDILKIIDDLN
ncbi:hypothetical protein [Apibacter sp. wkB309]|uniref:hypothetical protein n=1 Tax=Apibacter sp. wkB309 TaxID=1679467 RepID=UPI000CF872BF|nr:hypothetical protein [Apibacter sp. wkB309]PQL90937.1 hypothetical protein C4S75_05570 [Apibacter sp. wkB309]